MAEFLVGMDVGCQKDFSALAVVEKGNPGIEYQLRHLERIPLGTGAPEVVGRVAQLLRTPPLWGRSTLIVDATGAGLPVIDLLKKVGISPVAVTITGGKQASRVGSSSYRVPKRELVRTLVALVESGRLQFALGLPFGAEFREELRAFQMRINRRTGRATYASGKTAVHDDLVLALSLACWYGEYK